MNTFRAQLGLPPVRHIVTQYWHSPQLILCLFPPEFLGHALPRDWPPAVRLSGFPLYDESDVAPVDPAVEAFLQAGPPPIVFTPGSANTQAAGFFDVSAAAIAALQRPDTPVRAIFLTRHAAQVPAALCLTPEPAADRRIAYFPFIPLSRILPRCAALVSHGGIGTIAQGLAAGIPQLLMPLAHDQPDNAARLRRLGVGLALKPKRYQPRTVAAALHRLLHDPALATGAKTLGPQIARSSAQAMDQSCTLLGALLK
jgi:UDP:flavonoid glycosyltransferase YjiC (YdhE family)